MGVPGPRRFNELPLPCSVPLLLICASVLLAQPPAPELELLGRVRQRMATNLESLPNYTCLETIDRTVHSPSRQLLFADKLRVEVAFIGLKEMFAWPGSSRFQYSSVDEMVAGEASGFGSFAGFTHAVFRSSAPSFEFAGERPLDNRRTLQFDFRVPLLSSAYWLRVQGREARVPYSGSVWIDPGAMHVLRLQVRAGESGLPLESAGLVIDYARMRIGASEFLLPATSELLLVDLTGNQHRNAIRFSDCRQYGVESSISFDAPAAPPAAAPAETRQIALPVGTVLELKLESPIVFGASAVGDPVTARLERTVKAGGVALPKGAIVTGRILRLEQVYQPDKHVAVGLEFSSAAAGPVRAAFRTQLTGPRLTVRQLLDSRFYGSAPVSAGVEIKGLDIDDSGADKGMGLFRLWRNKQRVDRGERMTWTTAEEHAPPAAAAPTAAPAPPPPAPPVIAPSEMSTQRIPPPPEPPAPPLPAIRVTTRLVEVQAVVEDRSGRPVLGLTRDDFTLLDKGRAQRISSFSGQTSGSSSEVEPHPDVSSGPPGQAAPRSGVTVILFDRLNTRSENQNYARRQLVSFLKSAGPLGPGALYVLDSRLRVLADFTRGAAVLDRALARTPGRTSSELDASEPDAPQTMTARFKWVEQDLARTDRSIAELAVQARAGGTLAALEAIGHHLARVPGRKNLIWISDAFPFSVGMSGGDLVDRALRERYLPPGSTFHFSERIARAARVLTDANVAIYPVEARGLSGAAGIDAASAGPGFSAGQEGDQPGRTPPVAAALHGQAKSLDIPSSLPPAVVEMRSVMQSLAGATGGRAFYGSNDIAASVRRAYDDAASVYVLAYQPAHEAWDGTFRPIEVRVNRPGLTVRHRRGYFATAADRDPPAERERAMLEACASPLDATGIHLTATLAHPAPGAKSTVSLSVPASDVAGGIDALFQQQSADGRGLGTVSLEGPLGLEMTIGLDVVPAAAILRIVVRDRLTGRLGSIRVPVREQRVK